MVERWTLLPDKVGALEEEDRWGDERLHVLEAGDGGASRGAEESEADAYARVVRALHGIPSGVDRLAAVGNAVVPPFATLFGCFIQRCECRPSRESEDEARSNEEGLGPRGNDRMSRKPRTRKRP